MVGQAEQGGTRPISRATLSVQLEEALRHDILRGLFPPGHRLPAAELARHYGVSATPLREAMQRLAADGLVELDPRAGARVSPISSDDLRDIYLVRSLVEVHAATRSTDQGGDDWRSRLTDAMDDIRSALARRSSQPAGGDSAGAVHEFADSHIAFHLALVEACGSPRLLQLVESLSEQSERYRIALRTLMPASRDPLREHEDLYAAALSGDSKRVEELMREHLRRTVESLSERIDDSSNGLIT